MRTLIAAYCLAAAGVASARPIEPARLPIPAHADTEVSQSYPCVFAKRTPVSFKAWLEFESTPTNNVELAFGTDADGDGTLSARETRMVFGWDCGNWVVRGAERRRDSQVSSDGNDSDPWNGLSCRREVAAAVTTNSHKSATWDFALAGNGRASLDVGENGESVFGGLRANPPSWVFDRSWDTLRVTVRGVGVPEERVRVDVRTAGVMIIVK